MGNDTILLVESLLWGFTQTQDTIYYVLEKWKLMNSN